MREVTEEEFHASACKLKEICTEWVDADFIVDSQRARNSQNVSGLKIVILWR